MLENGEMFYVPSRHCECDGARCWCVSNLCTPWHRLSTLVTCVRKVLCLVTEPFFPHISFYFWIQFFLISFFFKFIFLFNAHSLFTLSILFLFLFSLFSKLRACSKNRFPPPRLHAAFCRCIPPAPPLNASISQRTFTNVFLFLHPPSPVRKLLCDCSIVVT